MLILIVMSLRAFVELGLEKIKRSLPNTLSFAFTLIRLAIHTGSIKAVRDDSCSFQVLPKSLVVYTARLPPRLSLMFSIKVPGSTSATCASVVFVRAWWCMVHVSPRSLLYMIPALGIRVLSIN